jgi:hypothetical protein
VRSSVPASARIAFSVKRDLLPFVQRVEGSTVHGGMVEEEIAPLRVLNESEPAVADEPLDSARVGQV